MHGSFHYGISGIVLPFPKKDFPPGFQDKSRLEFYATLFNSVEINSSFYKLPMASTVSKWAAAVPDHFKFTFKLSKEITHSKNLVFNEIAVEKFMNTINAAADKKGCILVQFPPSLDIASLNQLQSLLNEIAFFNETGWQVAVEFRHRSWYEKEVLEILDEHGACVVLHDLPASSTPVEYAGASTVYLRFHGPAGGYRGSYENDILQQYAAKIMEWTLAGKEVYCYFNNTMGDAVKNLETLAGYINIV